MLKPYVHLLYRYFNIEFLPICMYTYCVHILTLSFFQFVVNDKPHEGYIESHNLSGLNKL